MTEGKSDTIITPVFLATTASELLCCDCYRHGWQRVTCVGRVAVLSDERSPGFPPKCINEPVGGYKGRAYNDTLPLHVHSTWTGAAGQSIGLSFALVGTVHFEDFTPKRFAYVTHAIVASVVTTAVTDTHIKVQRPVQSLIEPIAEQSLIFGKKSDHFFEN